MKFSSNISLESEEVSCGTKHVETLKLKIADFWPRKDCRWNPGRGLHVYNTASHPVALHPTFSTYVGINPVFWYSMQTRLVTMKDAYRAEFKSNNSHPLRLYLPYHP